MHKRHTELYRTPPKPGYLGGYNWRATMFFSRLLLLVVVNFIATQYIAARFQYSPPSASPPSGQDLAAYINHSPG